MWVDALAAISLRNNFYQAGQRRVLVIFLISLLTNGLLVFILTYLIMYPPAPQYFPVGLSGHIAPLITFDRPNQPDDAILQWTSEAALASFSYSYVNYRDELQAASGFFTGNGWTQFITALAASNNLEAVKAKSMVVSAQLTSPPTILKKELNNGLYTWRIEVPVLVTYQNDSQYTQQYNRVNILVTRVSILNAPRGIGIDQLVVSPVTNGGNA
ncbi:MAG: type IV secretion protein DotI [Legionellales bacterium RIFCSPHIGHO2_12_FULL_42_9]|nr:MAG: type IV secretion protein DotI [Legionellales bacterium RIFCSPHIGHO2_12_FULL_42_9]